MTIEDGNFFISEFDHVPVTRHECDFCGGWEVINKKDGRHYPNAMYAMSFNYEGVEEYSEHNFKICIRCVKQAFKKALEK